jgi:DNA mismatch endonuclease, patch repair protein
MTGVGKIARLEQEMLSARMRLIRKINTKPEMIVRRLVHRMGFRFRLHRRDLPGTPDLVFPRLRKVIFVHGCFWHQHDCRLGAKQPTANRAYWLPKLARNVERDHQACRQLAGAGWGVLIIWECQTRAPHNLPALIRRLLKPP